MKIHHFNDIYQETWGFSWAMLVYQRVIVPDHKGPRVFLGCKRGIGRVGTLRFPIKKKTPSNPSCIWPGGIASDPTRVSPCDSFYDGWLQSTRSPQMCQGLNSQIVDKLINPIVGVYIEYPWNKELKVGWVYPPKKKRDFWSWHKWWFSKGIPRRGADHSVIRV